MKQPRLHIIHIETGRELYGGALQVLYLLNMLKKRRPQLKNTLVCPIGSSILKEAMARNIPCCAIPYSGELDPRLFFGLVHRLLAIKKAGDLPIIHIHSRRGGDLWGPLAAIFTSTPYIITRRVDNPEKRGLLHVKYKRAFKVVAISTAIRDIIKGYGIEQERIIVIRSGVDTRQYRPYPRDLQWFKQEFKIKEGEKAIGMVAQFIPRKGHHFLIEAMPSILREVSNAVFIFFGKGPLKDEIESLARKQGVYRACRFAGFREDMPRIFPCLDLLVHPALMEGLGVAVLQAMACMVPVLATQNGGLRDVVHHKKTALALQVGDLRGELAQKVPYLLRSDTKELRGQMVKNAFLLIKNRFSIKSMVSKYIALYEGLYEGLGL